jgi:transcriptional regulator with XRE-family HTH domain
MRAEILEMVPHPAPRQQLPRQPRAQDIDRHIGGRLRQRRVMNGLTQQGLADLIGVTYQQAHKYENGVNRIAAGRLYTIAQVLGVDVGYFFEGLQGAGPREPSPQQRVFLDLRGTSGAFASPSTRRRSACSPASWPRSRTRPISMPGI